MLYKNIVKPKVGQTFYMVGRKNQETYFKQMFIEKVIVTAKTDTPIKPMSENGGYDKENRVHIQKQWIHKEMKNHYLIETRCGELIDLSTNERACQGTEQEPLGKIFFNKRKAKRYFNQIQTKLGYLLIMDEIGSLGSPLSSL
jgi:hypothetical protein